MNIDLDKTQMILKILELNEAFEQMEELVKDLTNDNFSLVAVMNAKNKNMSRLQASLSQALDTLKAQNRILARQRKIIDEKDQVIAELYTRNRALLAESKQPEPQNQTIN